MEPAEEAEPEPVDPYLRWTPYAQSPEELSKSIGVGVTPRQRRIAQLSLAAIALATLALWFVNTHL